MAAKNAKKSGTTGQGKKGSEGTRRSSAAASKRAASSNQTVASKPAQAKRTSRGESTRRRLVARADVLDFRDLMFTPTLVEVPVRITVEQYKKAFPAGRVPILDQGSEGACTGYGLAAVANYLLHKRKVDPDRTRVSAQMLYHMAKRYDEWPGENYDGSSTRAAVKGWHKHGVCTEKMWEKEEKGSEDHQQAVDATQRPLGAYFRVNHRDLVAMHTALTEVGVLYASANVHTGWERVGSNGVIPFGEEEQLTGGHAFALVGYDEVGFWIQNSWGARWGKGGFARIAYADWLANATDVWVARLGVPVAIGESAMRSSGAAQAMASKGYTLSALRAHVIGLGNDGKPRTGGELGTSKADIERIFTQDFPRITKGWKKKRVLFYAHGGLVGEKNALQRVEDYREVLLENEIYPIAFIWRTDAWNTIKNMLSDVFRKRRTEGAFDAAKDFMLDRIDDSLEVLAAAPGGAMWAEMKENALAATLDQDGGARLVLSQLKALAKKTPDLEVHLAAHSAGSILLAPFVEALTAPGRAGLSGIEGLAMDVTSCSLWAPACSQDLFWDTYFPAFDRGAIKRFSLFTLKDAPERDDNCARIYNKSLLYLVSNAFELKSPLDLFKAGKPILGMEKFILDASKKFGVDPELVRRENPSEVQLFGRATAAWVRCPNPLPEGDKAASGARHHGDFDDDLHTVYATLHRILGHASGAKELRFERSGAARADRRRVVAEAFRDT